MYWSLHAISFNVWIKAGCAWTIEVIKPGLIGWASGPPPHLPPCPPETPGQSHVLANWQRWLAAGSCLTFSVQRTGVWASTQTLADLERHAMFETLSDLTEIGRRIWKGLQEDQGTEQLHKPNFLRKPKKKNHLIQTKTDTLEGIGMGCSQAYCSSLQLSEAAAPVGSFSAAPGYCFINCADSAVCLAAL